MTTLAILFKKWKPPTTTTAAPCSPYLYSRSFYPVLCVLCCAYYLLCKTVFSSGRTFALCKSITCPQSGTQLVFTAHVLNRSKSSRVKAAQCGYFKIPTHKILAPPSDEWIRKSKSGVSKMQEPWLTPVLGTELQNVQARPATWGESLGRN